MYAATRNLGGCVLTERRIRDAKPGSKTRFLWDGQVKNLGVRITAKGVKSYVVFYRSAGQKRLATLARVAEVSLREARDRAGRQLAAIRAGEADPLDRRRARVAPTVADGLDRFFDEYAPSRLALGRMSPRTVQLYGSQAKLYVRPALGGRRVADVGRRDVELGVGPLPNATRNRVLAFVSRLFNLFETWEWRGQQTNPVRGIERAREEPRDRVLAAAELAVLATALNRLDQRFPASVAAIRVTALTGLRISEVLAIRWEHVDFASRRVALPQTKTGRRWHHLPAAALDIVRAVPRLNKGNHVFAVDARGALTYRTVRHHFGEAAKLAGLSDVRLHDLRRTVMTNAAAAGVGTHVLRDLLGHKTTATADRYVRSVGSPVADAREAIGAAMAAAMAGEGARE
jgi:integrase